MIIEELQLSPANISGDVNPPTIELTTSEVVANGQNAPSFVLLYSDDSPPIGPRQPSFNVVDRSQLIVTGPNGREYSPPVFAGGAGEQPNSLFEIIDIEEGVNDFIEGEYSVRVEESYIVDATGNANAAQVLGTFEVVA